jgi:hypothetical protein
LAEAVVRYKAGALCWLDSPHLTAEAEREEREQFRVTLQEDY